MARMSETLRTLFTGNGSFSDRLIDMIDELVDPARPTKHPFRRSFIFEPLEERVVLNAAPVFVDLPAEITVIAGESFHLALNGYDADGDDLVFSTSSNLADVLTGNSSVRMRIVQLDYDGNIIQDFGYITFELLEGDVPLTTARIKEIIESGFYEDLLFHRIIDGFMIQGGSSDGYGGEGTGIEFADEFSALLSHNRNGMVSMANRGENTNDSQFFITDDATEWLDNVHSIFGFLTSGYDVLAKVSTVQTLQSLGVTGIDKDRPIFDVIMEEVEIFNDTQNGTLRIVTDADMAHTTQYITVMVDDGNGGQTEQTIKVNVATLSSEPLFEVPDIVEVKAGESIIVDFPEIAGIPGNQIEYFFEAWEYSHPGMQYEITADNRLKITAGADVAGPQYVFFAGSILYGRDWAYYTVDGVEACMLVVVSPAVPTASWTGGDNSTDGSGVTSNNNKDENTTLQFTLANLIPTASVELYANGVVMPFTIISDTYYDADGNEVSSTSQDRMSHTLVIETIGSGEYKLNDGIYQFTALQYYTSYTYDGYPIPLESDLSVPITVIVATVAPDFISPQEGFAFDVAPGETLTIDVRTNVDGSSDVTIAFDGEVPEGMVLSADGRTITWTPTEDTDLKEYNVTLKLTDSVGNTRTTTFVVSVQSGMNFVIDGNTEVSEGSTIILELKPVDPGEVVIVSPEFISPPEGFVFDVASGETLTIDVKTNMVNSSDVTIAFEGDVPAGMELSEDGRTITWSPTEDVEPGEYTITLTLTDAHGNTLATSFVVSVQSGMNFVIDGTTEVEEGSTIMLELLPVEPGEDEEPYEGTFIFEIENSTLPGDADFQLIPAEDGRSALFLLTPTGALAPGHYTITFKMTDEEGNTRTKMVQLTVRPYSSDEPVEVTFFFEIESSTLPGDADFQLIPGTDGCSATFTWTPTEAHAPGIYTITFKMTDEEGNTRTKMVQLTVNRLHRPPYFVAEDFEDVYEANPGVELVIHAKAHDDNIPKSVLTYSLLGDNIPDGMFINEQTGTLTWTPSKLYNGQTYNITILVTDDQGESATHTITIAIAKTNDPPEFTPVDPMTVWDDHGTLTVIIHAEDMDNFPPNDVRYSLVGDHIPDGMTINPTTGEITWDIPAGYAGSDFEAVAMQIEVMATKIIRETVENELGEFETIETEGLSGTYTVPLTIKSRAYEAKMKAEEEQKAEEEKKLTAWATSQMQTRFELDIPGLPGINRDAMHLRDMPNTPQANSRVETPASDPYHDTRFRNRFDRITFGIDSLGSGEVIESEETTRETEPEQPSQSQTPAPGQGGGYRSNRPISPGAFLRGVESGFSRLNTPLLDALENIDVQRAVSEARDAGQAISTYYSNAAQSARSSHDAALRDWDSNAVNELPGGATPSNGSRDQFRNMRLK